MLNELRASIEGEVYDDDVTRCVYSVDASIFEVTPSCIVIPKSKLDLIKAIKVAKKHQVPITVRGAATGITGGCLGNGMIIDVSKYLNKIIEINIEEKYAICEPGVVQDELNDILSGYGFRLGPDTSTGNRATLGGMLGNNAAGARSLKFGSMVDHVISVELALSSGELLRFGPVSKSELDQKSSLTTEEGKIYRTVKEIKEHYLNEIDKHFPKIPRRVSGYNLNRLNDEYLNIARLIVGSEGTLGIATEIKVAIVPKLHSTGLCLFFFDDLLKAFQAAPVLLECNPLALELIDDHIIELGRASPSLRGELNWLQGNPKAMLIFEVEGKSEQDIKAKLEEIVSKKIGYAQSILTNPTDVKAVWSLRKSGLGILLSKRSYTRSIAFIEDLSIGPKQLASFMEKFLAYLAAKGKSAGIYGHVGSGCMHIRPYINLQVKEERELMMQMMEDISSLVLEFGGSLSGEHGDGYIRSWLNPKMFGEKLMQAFRELKEAFDPDYMMNPGKIIPENKFQSLRTEPGDILKGPKTFLNFNREGGFELAVDMCNGNGRCRKKESVMCPSFQVTNEEFHSTRARAQALRGIIHGQLPESEFTGKGMHDVMDLCLSCKGCKTECPSQVDMAKMKAEFLYHYQEKWGYSLRSRLFAHIGILNSWMSFAAGPANRLNNSVIGKTVLKWIGISPQRQLPELAKETFSSWFKNYVQPEGLKKKAVLFNDTFNEFNNPEIGRAAVELLNRLGYAVIVLPWSCCGRPAISKGFLKAAKKQAEKLIEMLLPYAQKGYPIIGLEPSCILTLKDDYDGLIADQEKVKLLSEHCLTFDQFLANLIEKGEFNLPFKDKKTTVKVHGHCHQKALVGMKPTMTVLKAIPGFQVTEIHSGCCGMAGSFGYEKEHYEISMKIGELKLFPAVRESQPDTLVIANGMSCRHQIKDGTAKTSLHLAEALVQRLHQ